MERKRNKMNNQSHAGSGRRNNRKRKGRLEAKSYISERRVLRPGTFGQRVSYKSRE